jgi:environmental stress-induced protein Ves
MSWHVVQLADVAVMPWRNGGGVTRELAAWPARDAWHWRMSVA